MNRRRTFAAIGLLTCLAGVSAQAERSVVLVTNAGCDIETLSMLEVRKAYFGLVVGDDKWTVRAFRLGGDENLNQIFYQNVVAMSKKSYERRLLSMLLKYGTPRPPEYSNIPDLLAAVRRSDCGIVYLWGDDAAAASGIKTLRLLWQGE